MALRATTGLIVLFANVTLVFARRSIEARARTLSPHSEPVSTMERTPGCCLAAAYRGSTPDHCAEYAGRDGRR